MFELRGRTALVTGSARRLGRATALRLARAGMNTIIHYRRSVEEAEQVAAEARREGVKAWTVQGDLEKPDGIGDLFHRAQSAAGPIQVLVNNASVFSEDRLTGFSPESLQDNVRINALAPLLLCREFAANAGGAGVIVNFLDTRITDYDDEHAAYHLSKRMLYTITRMLALELAPEIRVSAVAPGLVLPPVGEDERYLEERQSEVPLRRHGNAENVARAVEFLVESDFTTGQVVFVDGGRHLNTAVY